MPKKPKCESKKLQGPLYGAVWAGKYCIVAGGGGGSFGIPNSISCIEHDGTKIGEVVAALSLGNDAPLRLAVSADSRTLACAVSSGGVVLVHLDTQTYPPFLSRKEDDENLRSLGNVKSIEFSRSNRWLATGSEEGYVSVFAWPSLRQSVSFRCGETARDSVRDVAFSSCHNDKILATVHEDGTCKLWELVSGTLVETLHLPLEMQRDSSFSRADFLEIGESRIPTLLTAVKAGKMGRLLLWEQDTRGELRLIKNVKALKGPITAMAVSRDGASVGCGSSDGDLALFSTQSWKCIRKVVGAHMVFTTAAAFSNDSKGFISVSADASLCTLRTTPEASAFQSFTPILMIISLLLLLLACAYHYFRQQFLS